MEKLACADRCPFGLSCGQEVRRGNNSCKGQIKTSLKSTDAELVAKGNDSVEAYAVGSEGSIPVGAVVKGEFKINEVPEVLPPRAV